MKYILVIFCVCFWWKRFYYSVVLKDRPKRYKMCPFIKKKVYIIKILLLTCLINLNNFVVHWIHSLSPSDVQLIFGRYIMFISTRLALIHSYGVLLSSFVYWCLPSNYCLLDYNITTLEDKIIDAFPCLKNNSINSYL